MRCGHLTGVRNTGHVDLEADEGQFPTDQELGIIHTEFSPGVRRMQALVGRCRVKTRTRTMGSDVSPEPFAFNKRLKRKPGVP
jgi:hypothetical protein